MTRTVLVVEDDPAIRLGVVSALRFAGYATLEAGAWEPARRSALQADWDLLLLDLVMPGGDGLDLLRELRESRPTAPVVVLTARGDERDRVKGLKLGADDYVVKPFSVQELLARVEAVLRRTPERPKAVERVPLPDGAADLARRELRFDDGTRTELTEREAELLGYLARHPGRTISRDELLARVWRLEPGATSTRAIDMQVVRLREKLRDAGAEPRILLTVRGAGYQLAVMQASPESGVRSPEPR